MATCLHCGERIPDGLTVCPRCGAFEPFVAAQAPSLSNGSPPAPPDEVGVGPGTGEPGFMGSLKDLGCQYAIHCGGLVAVVVIGVIIVVVAGVCLGGDSKIECQELHDSAFNSSAPWEDTETGQLDLEFKILEIASDLETDRMVADKTVCPGVAQTTDGPHSIWYVPESDGGFTIHIEPLAESAPAPTPRR